MRTWFTHHAETVLFVISALFVVVIVLYYVLVIRSVGGRIDEALNPNALTPTQSSFDLEGASKLDLRGLAPASAP